MKVPVVVLLCLGAIALFGLGAFNTPRMDCAELGGDWIEEQGICNHKYQE
jgi:hypothetical protein